VGHASELWVAVWTSVGLLTLATLWLFARHLSRERRERRRMEQVRVAGLHLPPSLHPAIDPDVCIGSAACVAACPEGDVLGLVGGAGRLIHGAACIGHGRCAAECPVGAIRLVFGTAERGADIPHLTPTFETSRPGVYIAGELGGMGLIRNAVRQGVGAARDAVSRLGRDRRRDQVDVAIVGAGPAGLGATLACVERGASYALLEQETFGGTVAHYPRQKLVLTEPIEVPLFGKIHRAEMTKEELLDLWRRVVQEARIEVSEGARCTGLDGEDGAFVIHTSAGDVAARKVILAIGRRGTPRKLGVPGEASPRVCYSLLDPDQYRGLDLLVVGGGDSALEAAAALAGEGGARVCLCYRGEGFFRAREKNRARVEELAKRGRLEVLLSTTVARLEAEDAVLQTPAGERRVPARYVLASLGGEAPTAFLQQLGIRIDRWFGKPPAGAVESTRVAATERRRVAWFGYTLFVLGLAATAYLTWVGRAYYPLSAAAREASALHERLRSSGTWGHGVGMLATLIMLTNFFYAIRKRVGWFRGVGPIGQWLTVHVLVGLFTPAAIAFHAAFQNKNLVAAVTYYAVAAVMVTGVVGRYVYGRVHAGGFGVTGAAVTGLKRFLRIWRMLHVVLAILMVLTIILHVSVSWLLGYRWIF
jgi:thioredoxin reductase/NAD-dependent dihydropyrimidine dehydrogenase PreA subunit